MLLLPAVTARAARVSITSYRTPGIGHQFVEAGNLGVENGYLGHAVLQFCGGLIHVAQLDGARRGRVVADGAYRAGSAGRRWADGK